MKWLIVEDVGGDAADSRGLTLWSKRDDSTGRGS